MEKKKCLLSFSGGETSAYMVYYMLKNKSDEFDFKIVFANTGLEDEETLIFVEKCSKFFNHEIIWVEANPFGYVRKRNKHKIVSFLNATRNQDWRKTENTPYEQMVVNYGLAGIGNKISTRELKLDPIESYLKSIGWLDYYTCIGIRSDELDRVSVNRKKNKIIYPLLEFTKFTKKHVNFWWSQQEFRLNLKGYQGNCITCYKKSDVKLITLYIENPENFDFFEYLENKYRFYIPDRKIKYLKEKGKYEDVLLMMPFTIFRKHKTVNDIALMAVDYEGDVIDENMLYEESCEIYSECGIDN